MKRLLIPTVVLLLALCVSGCTAVDGGMQQQKEDWCVDMDVGHYSWSMDCCLCKTGQMSNHTNGECCGKP